MAICITCIQNQRHHWQGFCESLQLLPQRDWGRGVWGEKNMWDSNDELFAHQLDKRKASKAIGAARTKIQDLKKSARHSQVVLVVKNRPANAGDERVTGSIPGGMATHSSILAWRISWTEKPGGLQSIGSHRVGHDWSDLAHTQWVWKVTFKSLKRNLLCEMRQISSKCLFYFCCNFK